MERKVQKNAQVSFCFLHSGAPGLFSNAIRAAKYLLNYKVHFALYGQDNYAFQREFMYF